MNKEQQIEEMTQDFINFGITTRQGVEAFAEILYNAGYRQIDENCAVITKVELKEYKRQAVKEFAERLKEKAYSVVGFNVCKKVYAKEYTINEIDINEVLKEYEK